MRGLSERIVDRVLALTSLLSKRGLLSLRVLSGAAIVICLFGAWIVVHDPIASTGVRKGAVIAQTQDLSRANTPGAQEVSESQRAGVVPRSVTTMALSHAGSTMYVLGRTPCETSTCPVLLRSNDSGRTWVQIHVFSSADSSALGGDAQPFIQPGGALSRVFFVSRNVGYVYGSDLWMTHDGGQSFTKIGHPGADVIDIAMWQGRPVALTASSCIQGICSGDVGLVRLSTSSDAPLGTPLATVTPSAPMARGYLAVSGNHVVVIAEGGAGSGDKPGSWSVEPTGFHSISSPSGCNGTPFVAVTGLPTGNGFIGLCDAAISSATTSYSPVMSHDGRAWVSAGSGTLTLPTQGHVSLASVDGVHLVAASGGPRLAPDGTTRQQASCALAVSVNAGKEWHSPKVCGGPASGGFDDVDACGAGQFVGVPGTSSDYWRSTQPTLRWDRAKIVGHGD